jgi:3-deoxy-D-manno-octulosonic-acid transferase
MIYWTYNALLTLTIPILVPYLLLRVRKGSRLGRGLRERLGFLETKRPAKNDRLIWFHASSVGEVAMAFPLIRAFCERFPEYRPFLSTMTETGQEAARRLLGSQGTTFFFPLDFPWTVRHVLDTLSPQALFIAETEIWPNLLVHCRRKDIPVVLFNGRISNRSFHRYRSFRFFFKEVLRGVAAFGMQSGRDAERIVEIGAPPDRVVVTGNLKFDRPAPDISEEEKKRIRSSLGLEEGRTLFVAGSTHAGEEEMILEAFRQLKRIEPSLVLILAPRHLERLEEIRSILNSGRFSWIRKSQMSGEVFSREVVLLDTMGELEKVYSIGTIIFVGRSLVPGGGHNILEPAAFGKPVIFGPHMENFREIAEIMKAEGGGIEVRSQTDLIEHAKSLIMDRSYYARVSQGALRAIQKNRGAIENTLNVMGKYLGRSNSSRNARASG